MDRKSVTRRTVLASAGAVGLAVLGSQAAGQEQEIAEIVKGDFAAFKNKLREAVATKTWRYTRVANPQAAATFVNATPAQVAGEISITNRADGSVDVYFFM